MPAGIASVEKKKKRLLQATVCNRWRSLGGRTVEIHFYQLTLLSERETRSTNSSRRGRGTFLSSRRHKQTLLSYGEFLPLILLSNNEANCNSPRLLPARRFFLRHSVSSNDTVRPGIEIFFRHSPRAKQEQTVNR